MFKPLFLTNTFGRLKELFVPQQQGTVKMYVCGITPYDSSHIGHGRVYVCFDLLYRLLKFLGYKTTYVRNVTDIDDKLLDKAEKLFGDKMRYQELAIKYMAEFDDQMKKLNCLTPDIQPRATEYIAEMLAMIQTLIEKNHAYVVDSDVYFDVPSFSQYGRLSNKKLENLIAGARVELNDKKKHPTDFALWKGTPEGEFWKSPWGYGRPGWHMECSAMILKTLGKTIDIHAGGIDLIFPHHENEIAQSECCTGELFTKYFLHNEFVNLHSEKMSKSLGNIITLKNALEQVNPMVWRFYILQHHYRMPIDFTDDGLRAACIAYQKIITTLESAQTTKNSGANLLAVCDENEILKSLLAALCDDLNSPKFMGIIFENLATIRKDPTIAAFVKALFTEVMGLDCKPLEELQATPEIEALIAAREVARKEKDWKKSDEIRDQLAQLGWQVNDKKLS